MPTTVDTVPFDTTTAPLPASTSQATSTSTTTTTLSSTTTTAQADRGYCVAHDNSMLVNGTCFTGDWPLSIEEGTLWCYPAFAVTIMAGGTEYALNGLARGRGEWAEVDPIWVDNPDIEGFKIDIGPLIDLGLTLCE